MDTLSERFPTECHTLQSGAVVECCGWYRGSLTDYHGPVVTYSLDDCACKHCLVLDTMDERRLATFRVVANGAIWQLEHVRFASLVGCCR